MRSVAETHEIKGDFAYPQGPDDYEKIKQFTQDVIGSNRYFRHEIERAALRNVIFYLGIQWVTYDATLRIWRPMGLKKNTPRPVTNKLAALANTTASTLVAYKVPITFGPASFDEADIAAANVADKISDIINKEAEIRRLKPIIARWIALTGNAFLVNQYDTSPETGTTFIQSEMDAAGHTFQPNDIELAGGVCPTCGPQMGPAMGPDGQPMMGPDGQPAMQQVPTAWQPAVNPETGEPEGVDYPRGKFYTEVKPLFSCYFDPEVSHISESAYFLVSELKGRDWVSKVYGDEVAKAAIEAAHSEPYTNYVETLAYSTALGGRIWGQVPNTRRQRVRVRRLWLKPHPEFAPEGIYAVMVGDKVVESGPWPYHNERQEPFLNVVHMGFDQVPGRLLYKTRIDDVAPIQELRNRVKAIVELHSIRMANAVWLVPEGSGVSRLTGEQGQWVKYNPIPNVPPPQRIPGDNAAAYLLNWLPMLDAEMDMVMSQSDIDRGETPRGVSAYSAIQYLDERSQAGQSNLLDNWSLGWMEWTQQMVNIWREYADEERSTSMGMGKWAMEKFSKAHMIGGVDISVELGQNRPRTQVGRRAVAEQGIRLGLANPFDPYERIRLLELIGIPELMEDFKIDQQRAAEENDQFAAGMPVQPPLPWDNHDAHVIAHRRFTFSDVYKMLPPPLQMAVIQHMQLHWMVMAENAAKPRKTGSVAPGGGENKGTASGGGGGGNAEGSAEEEMLDMESQLASPDTNTGSPGG